MVNLDFNKTEEEIIESFHSLTTFSEIADFFVIFYMLIIIIQSLSSPKNKIILNFDLENFFPSISKKRVFGVFRYYFKMNKKVSGVLTALCTHDGYLPQGAPTSPMISNMVCYNLDKKLNYLCKKNGCKYSRYVDDITISSNKSIIPKEIGIVTANGFELSSEVLSIILSEKFRINEKNKITIVTSKTKSNWH